MGKIKCISKLTARATAIPVHSKSLILVYQNSWSFIRAPEVAVQLRIKRLLQRFPPTISIFLIGVSSIRNSRKYKIKR